MTDQNLWKAIQNFKLDNDGIAFNFSQRLARDNSWNHSFSSKVIEEYKKFIYLCCISDSPITPSDAVDQAWHLHLTYTKSYWEELCKKIIKRDIHHNPTKGGKNERKKYSDCYDRTFKIYQFEFGHEPPTQIWKDNKTRFREINFSRINLNKYWLIKKPSKFTLGFLKTAIILILAPFLFIYSKDSISPFVVIVMLVVFIIILVKAIKRDKNGSGCDTGCTYDHYDDDNDDSGCSSDGYSGCGGCGGCGD